jgi:hypothetical protein
MLGPVRAQVSGHVRVSASDRQYPRLAASSGTQRARGWWVYLALLDQDAPQRCCAAWRLMPSRAPISAQE